MAVGLYLDHNIDRAITHGLRLRGVDVVTAFEDGSNRLTDPVLLDRSTALGRVLFSSDVDLVVEAHRRQREAIPFAGVIFAKQGLAVARVIEDLELVALAAEPDELADRALYLPLR